jgi:hypothetical protein
MICAINLKGETKTFEGTGLSLVEELQGVYVTHTLYIV